MIIASVRTGVQVAVAALVAWLISLGIYIGDQALAIETALFAVATGAVTFALNWLGEKLPWLNTVLSLGLSNSTASY